MLLDIDAGRMPGRDCRNNVHTLLKRRMVRITDEQVVKHPTRAYVATDYALTELGAHVVAQLKHNIERMYSAWRNSTARYMRPRWVRGLRGPDGTHLAWSEFPWWYDTGIAWWNP